MTSRRSAHDDVWAAGDRYEPYVGRWSRVVARAFVAWLAVPETRDWLDVGCGTGALSQAILDGAHPRSVTGIDPSAEFVAYAQARVVDPRATFGVGDAEVLLLDPSSVDAAVAGLSLNFVAHPDRGLAEMARVVRPGGVVAAYVWDYADRMELMRYFWDAATSLEPAAQSLDEGTRFPICQPQPLHDLFARADLGDIEVRAIDIATSFTDFDDYWTPFLGGQGPAPSYAMSLSESRRNAIRDRLQVMLPVEPDGSIQLTARAWAARGRRKAAGG